MSKKDTLSGQASEKTSAQIKDGGLRQKKRKVSECEPVITPEKEEEFQIDLYSESELEGESVSKEFPLHITKDDQEDEETS